MLKNIEGYVHSVETAGTVDGPGVRYVIFTSGCPLRCLYCHNPDSRILKAGKLTKSYDILKDINEYKEYHKATQGGVTISGGEPLIQAKFINSIFEGCKEMGIHTTLDTSGYMHENLKDEDLENIDLVMLDIKSINKEKYKFITNVELSPTLDFAKRLNKLGKRTWVRFVLVPDLTDDLDDIRKLAEFISQYPNIEKVEILPFHKMGESKWIELELDYALKDTEEPTQDLLESVRDIFKSFDIKTS